MTQPIRVFVGTPANNEDLECQSVFEWSLRKHTRRDVDIHWLMLSQSRTSAWYSNPATREGWNPTTWVTPFSALRWGIPAACDFTGRAIYCDCDMILRADIGELWDQELAPGHVVLAKGGGEFMSCVMLLDCEAIRPHMPPIETLKTDPSLYRSVSGGLRGRAQSFQGDWNCRDGEGYADLNDPAIKLLHYTNIPTQPNHKHARARLAREGKQHWYPGPDLPHHRREFNELFDALLAEAAAKGYGVERYRVDPEFGEYRG